MVSVAVRDAPAGSDRLHARFPFTVIAGAEAALLPLDQPNVVYEPVGHVIDRDRPDRFGLPTVDELLVDHVVASAWRAKPSKLMVGAGFSGRRRCG
jgi:hypothetical protein